MLMKMMWMKMEMEIKMKMEVQIQIKMMWMKMVQLAGIYILIENHSHGFSRSGLLCFFSDKLSAGYWFTGAD